MPLKPMIDIASLRVSREGSSSEQFQRFVGAINAANRLGHSVTLRVYSGEGDRGVKFPIDVYAEVEQ